jgi:hypothetical protein
MKHQKQESGSDIFLGVDEVERLIAEQRRGNWPVRAFPHIPITDRLFVHEKILSSLKKGDMTREQVSRDFFDVGPAIDKIVAREIARGRIEEYEKAQIKYLRITEEGRRLLGFSQGLTALRRGP